MIHSTTHLMVQLQMVFHQLIINNFWKTILVFKKKHYHLMCVYGCRQHVYIIVRNSTPCDGPWIYNQEQKNRNFFKIDFLIFIFIKIHHEVFCCIDILLFLFNFVLLSFLSTSMFKQNNFLRFPWKLRSLWYVFFKGRFQRSIKFLW